MTASSALRRLLALSLFISTSAAGVPGRAQTTPPSSPAPNATPTHNPLSYDDPGMHFQPPDDWKRIPLSTDAQVPGGGRDQKPPVALYIKGNQRNSRVITVSVQDYDGTLDAFEVTHDQALRNDLDSIYVVKKEKTTLANGMPAYWLHVNSGNEAGKYVQRYEWVVVDTKRSIIVSLIGHQGDFTDDEAAKDLSSLYVVVYPAHRE